MTPCLALPSLPNCAQLFPTPLLLQRVLLLLWVLPCCYLQRLPSLKILLVLMLNIKQSFLGDKRNSGLQVLIISQSDRLSAMKTEKGFALVEGRGSLGQLSLRGTPDMLFQCHPFSSMAWLTATAMPVAGCDGTCCTKHYCLGIILPLFHQPLEAGTPGKGFAMGISNFADFCQSHE